MGALAYAAAVALGGQDAREQVVRGDGAAWIKRHAEWHVPDAVGLLDWAHVARAVSKAIRAAGPGPAQRARRRVLHQHILDQLWLGDLEAALATLTAQRPAAPAAQRPAAPAAQRPAAPAAPVPVLEQPLAYLRGQRAWLGNYAAWQATGYPVGRGVIERAVAIVINWRMKRRGMRWCRGTASAVVALRVRELNDGWEREASPSPLTA